MADFDAGSIEGSLTVDRTPFTRGLEMAREQAEDFERDTNPTIRIDLDNGDALLGFDDVEMRADELDGRDINMRVDIDTGEAEADIAALRTQVDGAGGGGGDGGLTGALAWLGSPLGPLKAFFVGGAISTALGAIPALLGAATGSALGLGGALSVAGAGLLSFGAIAKTDFTDMNSTLKDLTKQQDALNNATTDAQRQTALKAIAADTKALQGPAGQAAKAYQSLQTSLGNLKTATAPPVFNTMTAFFNLASGVLPKLAPLITSTANALSGVAGQLNTAFSGTGFSTFIQFLSTEIGPVLGSLSGTIIKLFGGLGTALEKSAPLIDIVVNGLASFATIVSDFTASPAFDNFIQTLVNIMPQVTPVLGALLHSLVAIFVALEPAITPALNVITLLAGEITTLAPVLSPLVSGFVELLNDALIPLAPILTQLVMDLVPVLLQVLGDIAPLVPILAQAFVDLVEAVLPLVPVFAEFITELLPPFVGFLEVLIKEGIAPLVAALIKQLAPVLPVVAQSFSKILNALAPLIPVLASAFVKAIVTLTPVLPKLVPALANMAVAFLNLVAALPPTFYDLMFAMLNLMSNPVILGAILQLANAVTVVLNSITGLVKEVENAWPKITGFFSSIKDTILNKMADAASWLINTGSSIIQGLGNGAASWWNNVLNWFGQLKGNVLGWLGDGASWLWNVGYNIVHGLWNGITVTAWGWLKNQISGLGGDVVGWFKDAFHISSPSRLMADQVGKFIPLGIAAGIDENAHVVQTSVGKLTKQTTGAAGLNPNFTPASPAAFSAADTAHINSMSALVAQVAELLNVTKELPAATGEAVKDNLRPVLKQQTVDDHQYALQRGRQGAVGSGS